MAAGLLLFTTASLALCPPPASADDEPGASPLRQSLLYEVQGQDRTRGALTGKVQVGLSGCDASVSLELELAGGGAERLEARGQVVQGKLRGAVVPARRGLASVLVGLAAPATAPRATLELELADGGVRARVLEADGSERLSLQGLVLPAQPSPWSDEERRTFHHRTQGVNILPLAWLQALETADGSGPFAAAEHLRRFGFIPDPQDPQGLPVGLAIQGPLVGLTCAACHTTALDFQGRKLQVEGGRGSLDIETFRGALGQALGATATSPDRFQRFAAKVAGTSDPQALAAVGQALRSYLEQARRGAELSQQLGLRAVAWGYGRVDASATAATRSSARSRPRT